MQEILQDCVVVGGGPGGLVAAIYLSRFRLQCTVLTAGPGRASRIPVCRNFPGFPDGISGSELLSRMRAQLAHYGTALVAGKAIALEKDAEHFLVKTADGVVPGRTVLLATGTHDIEAKFENARDHDRALHAGVLHYCPICDGYEVSDKRVVVFGKGHHGVKEALFLRGFTASVELVCPSGPHDLSAEDRRLLHLAGITIVDGPAGPLRLKDGALRYTIRGNDFETNALYVAMGCNQQSDLAQTIGAEVSETGCVIVDAHQRTTVEGLYAVGDVVAGLDQIVTAVGQAAIAATTIRNDMQRFRDGPVPALGVA
jgi:thioredoxin reductase (NADPH)